MSGENVIYVDFKKGGRIPCSDSDDAREDCQGPPFSDADVQQFMQIAAGRRERMAQLSSETPPESLGASLAAIAGESNAELMRCFLEGEGADPVFYIARYQEILRRLDRASRKEYGEELAEQGLVTNFTEKDMQWFSLFEQSGEKGKMEQMCSFVTRGTVLAARRTVSGYTHAQLMMWLQGSSEVDWKRKPGFYRALLDEVCVRMKNSARSA